MPTSRISRLAPGFLVVLSACGDDGGPARFAAPVRLVDRLDGALIESAPDPAARPEEQSVLLHEGFDASGTAEVLVFARELFEVVYPDGDWPEAPEPGWLELEQGGGRALFLSAPSAAVGVVELPEAGAGEAASGPAVRVELDLVGEPSLPPCVYELRDVPTEAQLRDPERVEREVWPNLGLRHDLLQQPGAEPGRVAITLVPQERTRGLLFFAATLSETLILDELRITSGGRGPVASAPLPDELDGAHAARIQLEGLSRESVLLRLPARARFEVRVPGSDAGGAAPRFRTHVGAPDGNAGEVRVRVAVRAGGEAPVAKELVLEPSEAPAWSELELLLPGLAGREVTVEWEASAGAVAPVRLAFGNPTLEGGAVREAALPPDLLLVSLDTVRRDRVSLYGARRPTTPNLDALAVQGVVFERAISPASWTLPAHLSAFTGDLPARHGVERKVQRLAPERGARTLAAALRAEGYETLAFTGGGLVGPDFGVAAGFEQYSTVELVNYGLVDGEPVRVETPARGAALFERLRGPRRRPLFVFLHTYGAHNYTTSAADLRAIGVGEDELEDLRDDLQQGVLAAMGTDAEADPERIGAVYDATVFGVDALLGEALDALRSGGRLDSTYVAVFSDHGEELLEHGRVGHDLTLHEELLRVPLVVHGPGLEPARIEQVVSLCDIAPTFADLLLRGRRLGSDGRSLAPLLFGDALPARPVLSQVRSTAELHALRDGRYKLLVKLRDEEVVERWLHDVEADPGEDVDLVAAEPERAARMEAALLERLAELEREGGGSSAELELSPERIQELEDLGYL